MAFCQKLALQSWVSNVEIWLDNVGVNVWRKVLRRDRIGNERPLQQLLSVSNFAVPRHSSITLMHEPSLYTLQHK